MTVVEYNTERNVKLAMCFSFTHVVGLSTRENSTINGCGVLDIPIATTLRWAAIFMMDQ